ncbi:hypothetical protein ACQP2U_17405 [Nocardia sp. CA-084685]|uniref:hypothetical protein n=1 Tax=Nocardia sp. CA-084685 TaxID=3239970 RepID=UPI003D96CA11
MLLAWRRRSIRGWRGDLFLTIGPRPWVTAVPARRVSRYDSDINGGPESGREADRYTALICLDPDLALAFAQHNRLTATTIAEFAENPEILSAIEQGVTAANGKLSQEEQIKNYIVLPEVWEPGSDVLTATGKLERTPIAARYTDTIESLYS